VLVAPVLVAALALSTTACGRDASPVDRARTVVDDDGRFATSIEAGDALARVSSILLRAGKDCDGGCDALLSAAAYAQVLAVRVLDCTAPGRFQVRRSMRRYLDAVEAARRTSSRLVPQPPPPPRCG
jgi:hypothetical protein